jgi:hypothetical protein
MNLLVNIDVEDLEKATAFYCAALGRAKAAGLGRGYDEITLPANALDPLGDGLR